MLSPTELDIRLETFINSEFKLTKYLLAYHGFECQSNKIKCSGCEYICSNSNIDTFFQLFNEHLKYNENKKQTIKCTCLQSQREYVESFKGENDLYKTEKLPKKLDKVEERLATFDSIKDFEINVKELAENGMLLYDDLNLNQNAKKIKCYYCDYECIIFRKSNLNNYYEKPTDDHESKSPNCEIVRKKFKKTEIDGYTGGHVIFNLKNNNQTIAPIQYNINGNSNFELVKSILNKSVNASCDKPYHPGYATEQSRLESFREWPVNLAQKPNDLIKAGFYYYGIKDMVKCFYCNGGLRNWDPIDEPIVEHARWFPRCPYIRQLKGADYIEQIRDRYKDMDNGFKDEYDDAPQYYDVVNNDANNTDNKINSRMPRKRTTIPETINSRMDLLQIQKIIELGFTRNTVKQVIENKLSETGSDFNSNVELVKAGMKMKVSSRIRKNLSNSRQPDDISKHGVSGVEQNENTRNRDNSRIEKQFEEDFHFFISNITMDVTYDKLCSMFRKYFDCTPLQIK